MDKNLFIVNSNESVCGYNCHEEDVLIIEEDKSKDHISISISENEIDSLCRFHIPYKNKITLVLDKDRKTSFINYLKGVIDELEQN